MTKNVALFTLILGAYGTAGAQAPSLEPPPSRTSFQRPGPDADRSYMAANLPTSTEGPGFLTQNASFTNELVSREVGHELDALPHYGVFDYLTQRVDGDTVSLAGYVTREVLKSEAESAVKKIEGVSRVENDIEVLPLSASDDRIRTSVYRAIYGNASMASDSTQSAPPIHIIVQSGKVILEGTVTSQSDKDMAYIQSTTAPGVVSVTNNLLVAADTGI
jgi:hyperosmotically inducible protein